MQTFLMRNVCRQLMAILTRRKRLTMKIEDDDDVQRQTDTSLRADRHHIQKQVSVAMSTGEMEKKAKASSKENAIPKSASPFREEKPITENRNSSTHETLVNEMKVNLECFLGLLTGSA
ncbi:hypothetical protein NC652_038341 [Populus alba x Populus x berolinensis]|uniref:Uncharacterized protein n=2 Tax=Populus alba TaxID=43335 RepID=A0A4U5MZE6_POPAL|nr:hypothetical protein NC652_038341 [Populus alba x Populus x berolinensis]TKR74822.1 hypothetical protein D5086_0000291780 [Populus alba]